MMPIQSLMSLTGSPDEIVIAASDMRAYPPADLDGLIVLRLRRQDKTHVLEIADRMIPLLDIEPLAKRLWIVDEERIRIRGGE